MRRNFLLLVAILPLISIANSTVINFEKIEIDLGEKAKVSVELRYSELTAEKISYLIPYKILSWSARDEEGDLNCKMVELKIGRELICEPKKFENFSVFLNFTTKDLTEKVNDIIRFRYEKNILEPTNTFTLKVIFPEGYGELESNGTGFVPVQPINYISGSTGRRIFLIWDIEEVDLGESILFSAYYERLGRSRIGSNYIIPALILFSLVILGLSEIYLGRKRKFERIMENLKEDEKRIYLYIKEKWGRGGKCTQRDIVRDLNLSKARASRLLHELEERNLIILIKQGRKNVVKLK